MFLVGDVGGTNCRLAVYSVDGEQLRRETYPSAEISGLAEALDRFVTPELPIHAACFAVAGPVSAGRSHLTNLGWDLSAEALSTQLGVRVELLNDFHAIALAIPALAAADYVELPGHQPGRTSQSIAVLGAGTGLGEAILVPGPSGLIAVPGEGAHGRFAPKSSTEIALLRHLTGRFGHVSVERVVSGPGLATVYDFLRRGAPRHPALSSSDPGIISRLALEGSCPVCVQALGIFVATYADEAAGLALKINAGLVYLAGGISPAILPALERDFRRAFEDKGRYRGAMEQTPVRVITHPDPGLLGALERARTLTG